MELAAATEASARFVGRWRRLVSKTNWEKGRILAEWREALQAAGAAAAEFSDDAWCRLIGGLTPQHAGRLRRVHDRFSKVHTSYQGLYWSHFQAALDWYDAEMWLEGAVQNDWSVAAMRAQRSAVLGPPSESELKVIQEIDAEVEDEEPDLQEPSAPHPSPAADRHAPQLAESQAEPYEEPAHPSRTSTLVELPKLPDDLLEAFEAFKLSILRHKLSGWAEVSRDDLLATLASLQELALAPSEE